MILNGQVPHLTGFTRSVFAPGDEVELHWHKSKDEVFYAAEGKGTIEVDGTLVQVGWVRWKMIEYSPPPPPRARAPTAHRRSNENVWYAWS